MCSRMAASAGSSRAPAALQDGEGACVVAQGVFVGIDAARPVAGAHQVARTARTVFAVAEVMAERLQVFEARRAGFRAGLRAPCRRADAARCAAAAAGSGTRRRAPWCWRSDSAAPDAAQLRRCMPAVAPARAARHRTAASSSAGSAAASGPPRRSSADSNSGPRIAALCSVRRAARRQAVHAREQQALDRRWHFDRCRPPHRSASDRRRRGSGRRSRSGRGPPPRDTSGLPPAWRTIRSCNAGSKGDVAATEERRQQGLDRICRRAAPAAARCARLGRSRAPPGSNGGRPVSTTSNGRSHSQSASVGHGFDRRRVGPLQVLEHEHQRPLGEAALEHRAQRHRDLALEPLGLDLARSLDATAGRGCSRRPEPPARSRRRQRRSRACRARPLRARTPASRPARCRSPRRRGRP